MNEYTGFRGDLRKRPLEGHRHRWEDNIEMDLQAVGWGNIGLTDLAQDITGGRIL